MRYISVCSGIEAATAAWHPLGWEPAGFAEIDAFPSAVLAHHYPEVRNFGDFTKIQSDDVGPIDLLVGGTPCQPFSIAGKRLGLDDARGELSLEFLRLAKRLRSRWIVWENVCGILSQNGGRDFGAFLSLLVECGYGFAYRVLDAQFIRVDGFRRAVPQRRRRVILVGYLGDWRRAAAVLFEPESMRGDPAPSRKARQDVAAPIAAGSPGGSGYRNDPDTSEDGTGRGTPIIPLLEVGKGSSSRGGGPNGGGIGEPGDPMFTLQAGAQHAIAFDCKASGQNGVGDIASTLRSMGHLDGHRNGGGHQAVAAGWAARRLTPRECERLQGFPDDYTAITYRGKPAADGPRYKALGNSMAVNVMRWVGTRIDAAERALSAKDAAA